LIESLGHGEKFKKMVELGKLVTLVVNLIVIKFSIDSGMERLLSPSE
jgi:hypothetical protein